MRARTKKSGGRFVDEDDLEAGSDVSPEVEELGRLRLLAVTILKARTWCDGRDNPYYDPKFCCHGSYNTNSRHRDMGMVDTVVYLLQVGLIPEPAQPLYIGPVERETSGERRGIYRAIGDGVSRRVKAPSW